MKEIEFRPINEIARDYATKCHNNTNHLYDGKPYKTHLNMVVEFMEMYCHLIPEEDRRMVQAACWVHDVIEDCRQTYNDVSAVCGYRVAEIAYALTNEKGKNRRERANDKYYNGILKVEYACFVKLCDRLANVKYSKDSGSDMYYMYCKENDDFIRKTHNPKYEDLATHLINMCSLD